MWQSISAGVSQRPSSESVLVASPSGSSSRLPTQTILPSLTASAASLISFDEIAAEIQVTYESLETAPAEAAFAARGDTSVTPESP